MKIPALLLVICVSVLAAQAQEGKPFELKASESKLYIDPDWATSDTEDKLLPDKLAPLIPGHRLAEQGQIQETAVTKVKLKEDVNHGEIPVGVLGAYTEGDDGTITKILPGSDLLRLGVVVGDKIRKIDGAVHTNADNFRNACRGLPGSTMILTIERNGQTAPYIIKRTDARLYTNDSDGYYKWCVEQIKRW
ncbi:MAG: hypothetical protein K2Y22_00800 [Candidatus Obscuribacterales bacterium]|nr:hypothetical protein [Candidatus Obscuribacterales bacterium]